MSGLYPAMLRLAGQRCVVVGAGKVAARKVAPLVGAGAAVTVIAPTFDEAFDRYSDQDNVRRERRPYRRGDLAGATLAFAATDSRTVNAAVADEASELGIPVNVADDPAMSTFHVPASLQQQGLTISISTGGRSPAFARRLREELEKLLTPERVALLELYAELRSDLAREHRPFSAGASKAADEQALALLRQGRRAEARQFLRQRVLAGSGRKG